MLNGLGLAETTPGPLILVNCFVGFLAAFRDPGALPPMLAGALGATVTVWVTFVPSFLWIFAGAPFVERLRGRGVKQATEHRRMYRPWGHYSGLIMGDRFQVKEIVVRPGGKLSLQTHHHRAEHWVVVHGTARVQRDAESILLSENQSVYLPLGCVHRMENPGMIPLHLIEVQVGSYLGEDDIVRIEDTYGRS